MNTLPIYITQQIADASKIRYLFESNGLRKIIKIIEYTPVGNVSGRTVYNLGFGDYDENNKKVLDDTNSNNGDMRIVFNTVLSTVPLFFAQNPEAVIIVGGSDNHTDFIRQCKPSCKKKCTGKCKNYQRRIKTYRYYVDKNFKELSSEFIFFGRNKSNDDGFVQYIPMQEYDDILVYKKK